MGGSEREVFTIAMLLSFWAMNSNLREHLQRGWWTGIAK